jgi:hypothetical protein
MIEFVKFVVRNNSVEIAASASVPRGSFSFALVRMVICCRAFIAASFAIGASLPFGVILDYLE